MIRNRKLANQLFGLFALLCAGVWMFPLYWAFVTSIRSEQNVVGGGGVLPDEFNLASYIDVIFRTNLMRWYVNSVGTAAITTAVVLLFGVMCAYALSQIKFPGRRLLYGVVLLSFMVPPQALYVAQFILMNDLGQVNKWGGIILPQLIVPVVIVVYKQFFDAVPNELREAAVLDGASEFKLLFKVYLPLNWGITTALGIVTFIATWNEFFLPFLVVTSETQMTIPVGITQVNDAFGVAYARIMSVALLAAAPVAIAYLIFQRKVTEAVMISSGIKG